MSTHNQAEIQKSPKRAPLLHDVLRQQLEAVEISHRHPSLLSPPDSDEDETIDVFSGTATPVRSAVATRSSSPTRTGRKIVKSSPLALSSKDVQRGASLGADLPTDGSKRASTRDPLRMLPDKIRPIIFCMLSVDDLASCALVCQRWKKSQTINHAWYQLYRQETYQGSDLPVGKWTKRESKKDWRTELMQYKRTRHREESNAPLHSFSKPKSYSKPSSGVVTPNGYLTPREVREEEWNQQEETSPSKNELRTWYKENGGKRIRKAKTGMSGGMRDRTAWSHEDY